MQTIYQKLACCSPDEIERMIAGNGLVLVPREPTREMNMAGEALISQKGSGAIFTLPSGIYTAMIDAVAFTGT